MKLVTEKLKDERGGKVVFVAHCILNENVRHPGTAFRRGCIDEIVDELQERGVGIVQMPCPELKIYGGPWKRQSLQMFGSEGTLLYKVGRLLIPLFNWRIRRACQKMAKEIVADIGSWVDSDFEVAGILGVDGCPFCGVAATMDTEKSLDLMAKTKVEELDGERLCEILFKESRIEGEGFFVQALRKELQKRGLNVGFYALDFLQEYEGKDLKDAVKNLWPL